MSFEEILTECDPFSEVYFCGHPSIQKQIKKLCKKRNLSFYAGHAFH